MGTIQLNTTLDIEDYEKAGQSYEPIPEGNYEAVVFEVDVTEVKQGKYEGKPRVGFTFKLTEGQTAPDGTAVGGRQLWKTVNAFEVWSEKKQRFYPPFEYLEIGKALGFSTEQILGGIDTDDFLGEEVQVRVAIVPRRVKNEATGDYEDSPTEKTNEVKGFKSLKAASAAPAAKVTKATGFKL